jgi:hypothetical protein
MTFHIEPQDITIFSAIKALLTTIKPLLTIITSPLFMNSPTFACLPLRLAGIYTFQWQAVLHICRRSTVLTLLTEAYCLMDPAGYRAYGKRQQGSLATDTERSYRLSHMSRLSVLRRIIGVHKDLVMSAR